MAGNNFQFSQQTAPQTTKKGTGKIASTASRYGPKAVYDPFAASEDDFYSSKPSKSEWTIIMLDLHLFDTHLQKRPNPRPNPKAAFLLPLSRIYGKTRQSHKHRNSLNLVRHGVQLEALVCQSATFLFI